jgi:hypothetical protein
MAAGGPAARFETARTCSSAWSYRYERKAIVVTVPITAATTAMSATADTTSRVRSDHGRPRRMRTDATPPA